MNGIPESGINDALNSLEVTDVPCDHGGADLSCQKCDAHVVVLSRISWVYLSKKLGASQPAVSIAVKRGEQIAQAEKLEPEEN